MLPHRPIQKALREPWQRNFDPDEIKRTSKQVIERIIGEKKIISEENSPRMSLSYMQESDLALHTHKKVVESFCFVLIFFETLSL